LGHVDPLGAVVELGPGNGQKLLTLLEARTRGARRLDAHLVDVSPAALATASRTLRALDDVRVITHEARYDVGLNTVMREHPAEGRLLTLFLGSNIGNFDPPGAEAF